MCLIVKKIWVPLVFISVWVSAQTPRQITLTNALAEARRNNPVLQAQKLNILQSQADVVTAGLRPNPLLNNQTLQLVKPGAYPENASVLSNRNRQVWWQLTTPVNVNKQRQKAVVYSEQAVELSRRDVAETERNLLFEVGSQWLNAWSARRSLDLIVQAQQYVDTLVRINEVRLRNQVITQTDLLRTQVLADQYRIRAQTARQELQNQLTRLQRLLNTTDTLTIRTQDDANFWSPVAADSLLAAAQRSRADIRLAEQGVVVAESNTQLQQALRTPRPELGMIYNPQNSLPYIGFYGTMPLPFFNKNQGNIQKAKIQQQQAQEVVRYTRQQVQTEVLTAFRSYTTQRANLDRYTGILQQQEQILSNVRYAYLKGGTTIVDFLEAQRSWLDVQQTYLDTQEAYRRSLLQLLFATGQIQTIIN